MLETVLPYATPILVAVITAFGSIQVVKRKYQNNVVLKKEFIEHKKDDRSQHEKQNKLLMRIVEDIGFIKGKLDK